MNNPKRGRPMPNRRPMPRGRPPARGRPPVRGGSNYYRPRPMNSRPGPRGRLPVSRPPSSKMPPRPGMRKPIKKPSPIKKVFYKGKNHDSPNFLLIGLAAIVFILLIIFIWVKIVSNNDNGEDDQIINLPEEDLEMKISDVLVQGDLVNVKMNSEGTDNLDSIRFVVESEGDREIFLESFSGENEFFLNLDKMSGEEVIKVSIYPIIKEADGSTFSGDLQDSYSLNDDLNVGDDDYDAPPTDDFQGDDDYNDYYNYDGTDGINDTGNLSSNTNLNDSSNVTNLDDNSTNNSTDNSTEDPYFNCESHYEYQCSQEDVYWYDSCGEREELKEDCSQNEFCLYNVCVENPDPPEDDEPICGDNFRESGEYCDGIDLAGETCATFGFNSGTLDCDDNCNFDWSGCYNSGTTPDEPDEPDCTPNYVSACDSYTGDVYWYDSCGDIGSRRYDCTSIQTCTNGVCVDNVVIPDPEPWETGMISWWDFESNGNDKKDNNDGVVHGATLVSSGCKSGKCYDFDGINDYIDVGTFSVSGNKLTISAWVKWDGSSFTLDPRIISKASSTETNDHVFLLGLDDLSSSSASYRFRFTAGTSTLSYTAGSLTPDNSWHHIVAVYDGSTARIYVDNVLRGSTSKSGNLETNSDRVNIGRNPVVTDGTGRYWNGKLDEIMIWNRALSSSEVSQIYNYF
jgi:hypothetical protein